MTDCEGSSWEIYALIGVLIIGLLWAGFVQDKIEENKERIYNQYDILLTYPVTEVKGHITDIKKINLVYIDSQGFGSSNNIILKIILLTIDENKRILILDDRNYSKGEYFNEYIRSCKSLNAKQIFYLYFNERPHSLMSSPNKLFYNLTGYLV